MTGPDPTLRPEPHPEDAPDRALRPQTLSEFIGQAEARANLSVFIESARRRGEEHEPQEGPDQARGRGSRLHDMPAPNSMPTNELLSVAAGEVQASVRRMRRSRSTG